jgi:hypothetical protein
MTTKFLSGSYFNINTKWLKNAYKILVSKCQKKIRRILRDVFMKVVAAELHYVAV